MSRRGIYGATAIALFAIEVLIALFVRDDFVRPYVGDVLAVAFVYASLRALTPLGFAKAIALTLAVALGVEVSQALGLLGFLGLADNQLARIVLGGVFDWHDLMAYAAGGAVVAAVEYITAPRALGSV
ncbi:MAG: DUF2809 domain-containing protein [Hyphomonadaceae bacterium]